MRTPRTPSPSRPARPSPAARGGGFPGRLAVAVRRLRVNRRLTHHFMDYLDVVIGAEAKERASSRRVEEERLLTGGPGRDGGAEMGGIAWNLLHVAAFEEACCGGPVDGWEGLRHGAPPDRRSATLEEVSGRLRESRARFLARLAEWETGVDLDASSRRALQTGLTRRQLVESAIWHEAHHLTLCYENLSRQFLETGG